MKTMHCRWIKQSLPQPSISRLGHHQDAQGSNCFQVEGDEILTHEANKIRKMTV